MYKFLAILFALVGVSLMLLTFLAAGPIMDGVLREGGFLARAVFLAMLFAGGVIFLLVAGLILRTGQAARMDFGLDSAWENYHHDIDGELEDELLEEIEVGPVHLGERPKVE